MELKQKLQHYSDLRSRGDPCISSLAASSRVTNMRRELREPKRLLMYAWCGIVVLLWQCYQSCYIANLKVTVRCTLLCQLSVNCQVLLYQAYHLYS